MLFVVAPGTVDVRLVELWSRCPVMEGSCWCHPLEGKASLPSISYRLGKFCVSSDCC